MRMPVDSPYQITGNFGWLPGYPLHTDGVPDAPPKPGNGYGFHVGVDYVSDNKRVYLTDDATIQVVPLNGNDGNAVYYNLGNKRVAFCHLASFAPGLQNGGSYSAGTFLGIMGDTGYAEGVHLHLATTINGIFVDPLTLIEGESVMQKQDYPNKGDLVNIHNELGWPGHDVNDNDVAYWCTGTGNQKWGNVNDVWVDLVIKVAHYVSSTNQTGNITRDVVLDYLNQKLQ